MTVKIHIPSSDAPVSTPHGGASQRPPPGPAALITAGLVAVSMLTVLVISVVSDGDPPESSFPAPFEPSESAPAIAAEAPVWTERSLPGDGEIIAMGTVAETSFAVVRSRPDTLIWRLSEGAWQLDGSTDLGVESAVVMDNRILLLADQGSRPTVWEWVRGSPRSVFQPTVGSVVGMWSVGGRLVVSVAPTTPGLEQTIRTGRRDVLWMESAERDFDKLDLVNIESVLAVGGDAGLIAVGGRDENGQAAVGFVHGERVLANAVPGAPPLSAVTGFTGDASSSVAHVSVANRWRGTHSEIRSVGRDALLVEHGRDLVGIEAIDDVMVGVTRDGRVARYRLDGDELPAPPSPPWSYGSVRGLALIGDEPVAFGQSEAGMPMLVGQSVDEGEILMPVGRWERYHSEAFDGFHLFHIGSLEFATRDGELFSRSWNGERWRPAESSGGLVMFGMPRIVEFEWGYVLVPSAGAELWSSLDGAVWDRVDGSDIVRLDEIATDGDVLLGITHFGALGGPMSEVTLVNRNREITRYSLGYHVTGVTWEEGVGFVGTIAPPGYGYATSPDGLEWTRHDGSDSFEWVMPLDGALYTGSGESVVDGAPPAQTPGGEGWLFSLGETRAFRSASGATWIFTGEAWVDADFTLAEGLPGLPDTVIVRGSKVFAMVDGIDGVAETYVLELD